MNISNNNDMVEKMLMYIPEKTIPKRSKLYEDYNKFMKEIS